MFKIEIDFIDLLYIVAKFQTMKSLLFALICCFLGISSSFSQVLTWSPIEAIGPGNGFGRNRPRIVVTNNDVPIVMWGNANTKRIYVSRRVGTSFSAAVQVNPTGTQPFITDWAAPGIACSGDTVFVVYEDGLQVFTVRSLDGGATWGDSVRVTNLGADVARFPDIATIAGGNPVVTFMRMTSSFSQPDFALSRSIDGGQTYLADIPVANNVTGDACDCCPPGITAEGNKVAVLWRNNNTDIRDIWVALSSNGGMSIDTALDMDLSDWNIAGCPSSGPDAYYSNDSLFAVWKTGAVAPGPVQIGSAHFQNHGFGWNRDIDPLGPASQNYPRIAGKGDTLGTVWEDNRNDDTDPYFSFSTTGPANLLNPGINLKGADSLGSQKNPDIAFRNRKFHFVWQDEDSVKVYYRSASFNMSTGIENDLQLQVEIFPNPNTGSFYIGVNGTAVISQITIRDLQGKIIFSDSNHENTHLISLEGISRGIYLAEISADGKIARKKIVLE